MILKYIVRPYNRFANIVSSQDLLKSIAMLTMIIDHLGMCFFPELLFLRAIGRSSAIIWFFFCGYNYRVQPIKLWSDQLFWASVFFTCSRYLVDGKLYLNVLFTLFISRLFLGFYSKLKLNPTILWSFLWIFSLATFTVTNGFLEYGTLGILCSVWGYNYYNIIGNLRYQAVSILVFYLIGWVTKFHGANLAIFLLVIFSTIYFLANFKSKLLSISGIGKYVINISSRYSLYIYILHLLGFLIIKRIFL